MTNPDTITLELTTEEAQVLRDIGASIAGPETSRRVLVESIRDKLHAKGFDRYCWDNDDYYGEITFLPAED